jgi:hypothetical protein
MHVHMKNLQHVYPGVQDRDKRMRVAGVPAVLGLKLTLTAHWLYPRTMPWVGLMVKPWEEVDRVGGLPALAVVDASKGGDAEAGRVGAAPPISCRCERVGRVDRLL